MTSVLKGKHILVVDDEKLLREAIAFDFKRQGCVLFLAAGGKEALGIVLNNKIDAVISDVRMPNGDGVSLLDEIRTHSPDLPIVLLVTGFADIDREQAQKHGAIGLLEKPIDRKKLMSAIVGALTGSQQAV
jgi:CheY-like chemotaxis protein